jgi:hypothetical protein
MNQLFTACGGKNLSSLPVQVWVRQQDQLDEAECLSELPHVLRNDVMLGMAAHVLSQLPCFAMLSPSGLQSITGKLVPEQLLPGHILCEQEDPADCAWILHEGRAPHGLAACNSSEG